MELLDYKWNMFQDKYHLTIDAGVLALPSKNRITILAKGSGGNGDIIISKVMFTPLLPEPLFIAESEKIKNSEETMKQIYEIRDKICLEERNEHYFKIDDVHIVRATIDYTRKVVATGTNLKNIKEEKVEKHSFFLLLFSSVVGHSLAAEMKTKISRNGKYDYSLQILKNDAETIKELLYPGWKRDAKKQIKHHIEKKENLYLPIILH